MGFGEAVISGFKNFTDFDGRALRSEYWYSFLFTAIVYLGTSILDALIGSDPAIYLVGALALLLPGIAVGVRRLHDIDKSGWNLLWGIIPILGGLYVLYLAVQDGTPGSNEYGAPWSSQATS